MEQIAMRPQAPPLPPAFADLAARTVAHKEACGRRLNAALHALGLKPSQAARVGGISQARLTHYLRGRHHPDPVFLTDFSDATGITADFVLRGTREGMSFGLASLLQKMLAQEETDEAASPDENPDPKPHKRREDSGFG